MMTSKQIAFLALCLLNCSLFAQIELQLPEMEGSVIADGVPFGYRVNVGSPDIIDDTGEYPEIECTVENMEGGAAVGETVVYLFYSDGIYGESFSTELTDLKVGQQYTFSVLWQQIKLVNSTGEATCQGGGLIIQCADESFSFESSGLDDEWQTAKVVFKATSKTVTIQFSIQGQYKLDGEEAPCGNIVVDNYYDKRQEAGFDGKNNKK